jgi:hypothetical protein
MTHDPLDALDHIIQMLLEDRYERRSPAYLDRIARSLRVIAQESFMDMLEDAMDDGRLTEAEWLDVRLTNVVLSGRCRERGQEIYVLVEVSLRVSTQDVERAIERATILEKLGRPVLPVVAGRWINDEAVELAHQRGVWFAQEGRLTAPRSA